MSSVQKRRMENGARRPEDYVNVGYAFEAMGARNFLASIGTQRITPDSPERATSRYNLSGNTDSINDGRGRQKREKETKNKTKMLYSTLLEETDSSSMDGLSVSSELLEARAREEEHYNKLKLNINQLEDKRVRKGVSVLYADRVNGDIGFRKRTPSGSRMTRPVVIPASHLEQYQVRPSFLTAKNEGHVNSVHSVSGKPMSHSSSILWKKAILSKSFSTGDMCRIATEGTDGHEGDGKNRGLTQRSHSFTDIAQASVGMEAAANRKIPRRRYENVGPINNTPDIKVEAEEDQVQLRPRLDSSRNKDEHSKQRYSVLRYSTSTAEAIYSNTHATSESYPLSDRASPSPYLSPTRSPQRYPDMKLSRLSPLARPSDMKSAPLSPLLQTVNLHNDTCPITCTCHGINFIDTIVTIPCDSNGGEYVSEAHDFKIVIPKGAIKKRLMVELQIGVTLQGPFQTPQNMSVVSPIVWVGMIPDVKLKKPMEIELPHFLDLTHSTRKSEIFLRAADKSKTRYTAKKYAFKEATDGHIRDSHGILLSKHCGFFCIASNNLSKQQARCCLLTVLPKPIYSNTWKMHYCVTYLLKSCIQIVQRQFGGDWEILPPRKFTFSGKAIEIGFERQLLEAGWILALESSHKILASEVSLWSSEDGRSISIHPPRFTIRVHGGEARMSSMAQIRFTGCSEEMSSEIVLPLRAVISNGGTPLSTPTSSLFSHHHGSSQESSFMTTPAAPTQVTRLGWQCHSPSCRCNECCHEYDHLPSLGELRQTHVQLTYNNGHIDLPSDEDLRNIATKVTQCVQGDWTALQATLDIPDYTMLDVLSQRSIELQVYRLLKEWRNHAKDCSKDKLAECLAKADHRLEAVSMDLVGKWS